jgi:hypothetical protein
MAMNPFLKKYMGGNEYQAIALKQYAKCNRQFGNEERRKS